MYKDNTVAVIIPAYNEEKTIGAVIEGIPPFVDSILIVDDKSTDATVKVIKRYELQDDPRVLCVEHTSNKGTGAARISGVERAASEGYDVLAFMDGDGQMDPADLSRMIDPIISGQTDLVKANRLFSGEAWNIIPKIRYLGNAILSLLTKIASGYWHIADSQSGFIAFSSKVLQLVDFGTIYPNYGFPNDLLVHLNVAEIRVRDLPTRPIYNVGERSNLRIWKVAPRILKLLFFGFLWRLKEKYVIRNFHPLVFFYAVSAFLFLIDIPLILRVLILSIDSYMDSLFRIPLTNLLLVVFLTSSAVQLLLFAMWLDMENNKHLKS